jgi:putative addiction module component (TIGR02574 family)
MTQTVERIIAQIEALSPEERDEVAFLLLRDFDPPEEVALAWEAEVNRRLRDMREKMQKGVPAAEVFAELRRRKSP